MEKLNMVRFSFIFLINPVSRISLNLRSNKVHMLYCPSTVHLIKNFLMNPFMLSMHAVT